VIFVEENELSKLIKTRAKPIPLKEIRKITAKMKTPLSKQIIKMRHEED